jgi:hypothetical protein
MFHELAVVQFSTRFLDDLDFFRCKIWDFLKVLEFADTFHLGRSPTIGVMNE